MLILPALACALCHSTLALAAAEQSGPAALYAGPVAITPTLGTELKYRNNIYLQETDETDSWIALARPAVTAKLQDRDNIYNVGYRGEAS